MAHVAVHAVMQLIIPGGFEATNLGGYACRSWFVVLMLGVQDMPNITMERSNRSRLLLESSLVVGHKYECD